MKNKREKIPEKLSWSLLARFTLCSLVVVVVAEPKRSSKRVFWVEVGERESKSNVR